MELNNAEQYAALARATRQRVSGTDDFDLARRLREVAIRYERNARRLQRMAAGY